MTINTKPKNIFGDHIDLVDEAGLAKRIVSLCSKFSDVINKHKELSDYFEGMLNMMESKSSAILFLKLARWLKNQSSDFHAELEVLLASNELANVFEVACANWAQKMMLDATLRRGRIREIYATQVFPMLSAISIPIGVIHQESHHANHVDMVYVCGIANAINARKIFEFGTYRGQTTCGLAAVCKDAQIYTLNLPPDSDPRYAPYLGIYIARSPDRNRIKQIYCNSLAFDTTPFQYSMDYIFIDGDHSYEGIKNDTEKALQLLKPGGVIVWHDYAAKSPGVLKYLVEFSKERPIFQIRNTCLAVYVDGLNAETAQLPQLDASLEQREYGMSSK